MPTKSKFFYGWIIVLSSFLILFVSQAYTLGGLSVFDKEILGEFGWSVGDYKLKGLITFLFAGLLAPFMGALADKHGVRPLMIVGIFLLAIGYFFYSKIASLTHVYMIHILFAGALASAGLVVNVMLVSRWFNKRRGTALGLILMGTSLGNMIVPKINVQLISLFQWRPSFVYLAIIPLILIPIVLFIIKEYPSDIGETPDGSPEDEAESTSAEQIEKGGMAYGEAMRNRKFWELTIIAMCTFYAILALADHMFLFMLGQGHTTQTAASGLSVLFGLALVGKFFFGFLSDHMDKQRVFNINIGTMFAGVVVLVIDPQGLLWPAVILIGLGWGGLYTLLQILTAHIFGMKAFGKIMGTMSILDGFGGGMGMWLTGVLYDKTGSYTLPFNVIAVLVGIAFVLSFLVKNSSTKKSQSNTKK